MGTPRRSGWRRRGPLVALVLAVAAGCGSNGTGTSGDAGDGGEGLTAGSSAPPAPDGDPAAGEELVTANGCNSCHTTTGQDTAGPTWQGLAGAEVELDDGSTVTADEAYLREAITEPDARVVAGFSPAMPDVELTADEVSDIVAYIWTLEE